MEAFATLIARMCMIVGGVIPYLPQYMEISKTEDASGFSTLVCFFLILANTLRIVYWFGHYFDECLLLQSLVMLLAMFLMLELCIRTNRRKAESLGIPFQESKFFDFHIADFWRWTELKSYFITTGIIFTIASAFLYASKHPLVVEGIGYASLLTESLLAVPQFVKNFNNHSVQGMSVMMVLLWAIGDAFKEVFYIWKEQPFPFILNACIQLTVDFAIFAQVLMY